MIHFHIFFDCFAGSCVMKYFVWSADGARQVEVLPSRSRAIAAAICPVPSFHEEANHDDTVFVLTFLNAIVRLMVGFDRHQLQGLHRRCHSKS